MGLLNCLKKSRVSEPFTERVFECKRDGLTIRGTEYRPAGDTLPVAIVSHGFMAFQDTVRQYAKALARLGYCAYCFDFCGGSVIKGKSDGDTREMSVLTEVRDLEAVITYVQSLPYTGSGATCDGNFFKGKRVVVSANENGLEDIVYLANLVEKVFVVSRKNDFCGDSQASKEIQKFDNVEVISSAEILSLSGNNVLENVKIKNLKTQEISNISADGIFILLGKKPDTNSIKDFINTDEKAFSSTCPKKMFQKR